MNAGRNKRSRLTIYMGDNTNQWLLLNTKIHFNKHQNSIKKVDRLLTRMRIIQNGKCFENECNNTPCSNLTQEYSHQELSIVVSQRAG